MLFEMYVRFQRKIGNALGELVISPVFHVASELLVIPPRLQGGPAAIQPIAYLMVYESNEKKCFAMVPMKECKIISKEEYQTAV